MNNNDQFRQFRRALFISNINSNIGVKYESQSSNYFNLRYVNSMFTKCDVWITLVISRPTMYDV